MIVDLPDNAVAAGFALRVAASGMVEIRTVVLLTPEEIPDRAAQVPITYVPPGS